MKSSGALCHWPQWDLLNLEPCQGITLLYIYIQNHIKLLYQRIH
jgi:hypothetical protein